MQQVKKKLEKEDLKTLFGVVFLFHIFSIHLSNYNIPVILISCSSLLISLAVAFFMLFKKAQTEKAFNKIWGIVGVVNAFTFAFLFAFSFNAEPLINLLIFTLSIAVILVIISAIKLLYDRSVEMARNKKNVVIPSSIIAVFSAIGALIGVYLSHYNVLNDLNRASLFLGLLSMIFAIFSIFLFKSKDCE